MSNNPNIIKFHDHADDQEGFVSVRKFEDKIFVCLSLETNGDAEALIEKEVVLREDIDPAFCQLVQCRLLISWHRDRA